jgi:hypothetical protein
MRDGVTLAADVYRPDALGRFPVILQRTCRGRRAAFDATFFARRGYVYVAQDVRGRFDSDGDWRPWVNEARDGSDTLDWCAAQRWSNGSIGMIGDSYSGFTQWAVARERNPHLKCIVPIAAMLEEFTGSAGLPNVPALQICGWFDPNTPRAMQLYQAMAASHVKNQKIICGPWPQAVNSNTRIGRLDFGLAAIRDIRGLALDWFDRWLKNAKSDSDREPPVEVFLTGVNQWRSFTSWPPREAKQDRWYLHSNGRANSDADGGDLSAEIPGATEPPDRYEYNPLRPFIPAGLGPDNGGDLFEMEVVPPNGRSDVLTYTSYALDSDTILAGPIDLQLASSSTAPDTGKFAALIDVTPDGKSSLLAYGPREVHDSKSGAKPDAKGASVARIRLGPIGHAFKKGHRIRVAITSAFLPYFAGHLNKGADRPAATNANIAQQAIYHSLDRPSFIVLPTLPR